MNENTDVAGATATESTRSRFDDVEDVYPLSRTQAGMLFHSDYGRELSLYHDIVAYTLGLPWDEACFRQALAHLSGRHPVFRTAFDMASLKEPVQLVHRLSLIHI